MHAPEPCIFGQFSGRSGQRSRSKVKVKDQNTKTMDFLTMHASEPWIFSQLSGRSKVKVKGQGSRSKVRSQNTEPMFREVFFSKKCKKHEFSDNAVSALTLNG